MAFSDDVTSAHVHLHAIRPGLRLKPLQSRGTDLTEEEIDKVIARTLAEERQIDARSALPVIASQEEISGVAGRIARRAAREQGAATARLGAVSAEHGPQQGNSQQGRAASAPQIEDLSGGSRWRLPQVPQLGVVPRRLIIAGAVIAVVWMWPAAVLTALIAILLLIPASVVALGSDTVSGALIRLFHWRHARDPDQAELMRARLDRLAIRVDAILDRLPEGWTTGLYMADFSREALLGEGALDTSDPFDKLRGEATES